MDRRDFLKMLGLGAIAAPFGVSSSDSRVAVRGRAHDDALRRHSDPTFSTFDANGILEDLSDQIYNIDPSGDAPFMLWGEEYLEAQKAENRMLSQFVDMHSNFGRKG